MAPSQAEAPVVVNNKKRSRKWVLACVSLAIATGGAVTMEFMAFTLALREILDGEQWRLVAVSIAYWWMFVDLGILGGYGIPNVVEKWAPKP
ncbi:MAG: hypothetical protein ACYSW8_25615 [Planctomycetota bacterium]